MSSGTPRCAETSVYKAIRENRLVARKAGKRTLITAEDLNSFLQSLPRVQS